MWVEQVEQVYGQSLTALQAFERHLTTFFAVSPLCVEDTAYEEDFQQLHAVNQVLKRPHQCCRKQLRMRY